MCDTMRRDGCLAGIGEELGVMDLLVVDRRLDPRADTIEFGVVLCKHRDEDAVLLHHKKDLRRVDKDEVLVVQVNVGRLVKGHVRERVDVVICL